MESETADGIPSYLQPDKEPEFDAELNLPSAPSGQSATPANRNNSQVMSCIVDDINSLITCFLQFSGSLKV